MCNVQIARMLEPPAIYRKVYDQPFHSPALKEDEALSNPGTLDLDSLTCLLSEKAKEFLVENRVQTFYQQELETVESLLSLANQPVIHSACSGQVSAACPREKSRPLPQICSWRVWVDVTVALRLTGCTQSVGVMWILFWKGH